MSRFNATTTPSRSPLGVVAVLAALALVAAACSNSSVFDSIPTQTSAASSKPATAESTTTQPSSPTPTISAVEPDPDPTPLPIDPDVRIGSLDNGMTYYLRSNQSPGGSISLRLAVDAGSAQQVVPDGGTAHFLEHMMFNGTENFPGNELTDALNRLGIEFGADTNAYTSYDETVYMLAADSGTPRAVSTAFDVLAEWANGATLSPADVISETGVVRDEMRQGRESADGMIFAEFEDMYTAGSSYAGYATLGSAESVESMTAPPLRDFYDRWYRPDNMAVVVVGDMPLDQMEDAVVQRFSSITARGTDHPPRQQFEISINPDPTGRIIINPGNVVNNLSVDIQLQPWDMSTVGGERMSVIENLLVTMIDNRMSDGFQSGTLHTDTSPVMEPFAINRGLRYIGTNLQGSDLEIALTELISIWKSAAATGFSESEFNRAAEEFRAGLDAVERQIGSRQDSDFAATYVADFLEGADIGSSESSLNRLREVLDSLSPIDISNYWAWISESSGPIMAAVGTDASQLPTGDRMVEIAVRTGGLTPSPDTDEPAISSLMTRPDAVAVVDTKSANTPNGREIEWTFPNGAKVVFHQSQVVEGSVELTTVSEGGWSQMPVGSSAVTDLTTSAVANSGLGDINKTQLDRYLNSHSTFLVPFIDATTEGFVGSASSDDLEILFQRLNLSITAARIDDPAFREAQTNAANLITASTIDPGIEAEIALNDLRTKGDPAWIMVPTEQQLANFTSDHALDLYNSRLGHIDNTIIAIVGDVDVDEVEDLARRYIGNIDSRPHDTWADLLPPMPNGVASREILLDPGVNTGGVDIFYSTPMDVTARVDLVAQVLATILSARIIDTIREELGASYGGTAAITGIYAPQQRVDASISIDGDPGRVDEIRGEALAQIAELANEGPTGDEFGRAISVISSDFHFVDNQLFANTIINSRLYPDEVILSTDNRAELLAGVRPADVKMLARTVLPSERHIEVVRRTP